MDHRDAMLAVLTRAPATTAVLVDFDGSLSPIVEIPADAAPLPEAVTVLRRLVEHLGRVAVVSGRPVEFLATMLPIPGLALAGLYGTELVIDGRREVDPRVVPYGETIAVVAAEAESLLPGVLVERKAGLSVTLHWRRCPEREEEVRAVAARLAAEHGLDAPQRGKKAIELRPPVALDKGTAVDALVAGCTVAAFAGDDAGDLPAFDALDRLVDAGSLEAAVRIGVRSDEAPPEILERADVVVVGPDDLVAFLTSLVDRCG